MLQNNEASDLIKKNLKIKQDKKEVPKPTEEKIVKKKEPIKQ